MYTKSYMSLPFLVMEYRNYIAVDVAKKIENSEYLIYTNKYNKNYWLKIIDVLLYR